MVSDFQAHLHTLIASSPPAGRNDPDFIFTGGQGCGTATGDDPVRNSSTLRPHCPMQTDNEYRTSYSMWAIGAVPLLVAVDVANMTAMERSILTNPHVARMHIDPLGAPGVRIAVDATCATALPPTVMTARCTSPSFPATTVFSFSPSPASVAGSSSGRT